MTRFMTGLDLGQTQDFTALVTLEQSARMDERGMPTVHHLVRYMERFPLGTPYPAIVTTVRNLFAKAPLVGSRLIIDRTGVGAPVFDLFRESGIRAEVSGWNITAGQHVGDRGVPKKDLVGAVQAALGTRRLQIAPELSLAQDLVKELEAFRAKITPDRNETYSSWRERDHDDLVLALSLAVWVGERQGPPGKAAIPMIMGSLNY